MKNTKISRILSIVLCVAMLFTVAVQGTGLTASAASSYENVNLIADPSFETKDLSESNRDANWGSWQGVVKSDAHARTGSYSVELTPATNGGGCSLEQHVSGLTAGLTYVFSIWVKLDGTVANAGAYAPQVGANQYGGSTHVDVEDSEEEWVQYSTEFTYDGSTEFANVYVWMEGFYGAATEKTKVYVDDASLTVKGDIQSADINNGTINVTMSEAFEGTLVADDFAAVYTTSADTSASNRLPLTGVVSEDGKSVALSFDKIPAIPVDQTITVTLRYANDETLTLDYVVEASGSAVLVGMLDSVAVDNGSLSVKLTNAPTVAPSQNDFSFAMTVDGEAKDFKATSFAYDASTKTVDIDFVKVSSIPSADRDVTVTVTYNGASKSGSYNVESGSCSVYYVSSTDGDDNNDGKSEKTAFASIAKLNTITFIAGDQILFKKGDTFVGTFKPNGSGTDGAPIVVSSYGDAEERPVIQSNPEGEWDFLIRSPSSRTETLSKVNGAIWLENIEYWEIRDLELVDPTYDPSFTKTGQLTTYNAGIRVVNIDMGDLTHYVFDNLVIHGFRGPGTNLGKTSGGIQFNVDSFDRTASVKSCFADVRVTNCEIYECGRDGINTLSIWGTRKGYDKYGTMWSSGVNYGTSDYNSAYGFYPNRDFYMANCSIHDIDGDGLIVDTWDGVIVENNDCYRCAIHMCTSMRAAVGLFNWNSDNVIFQYNNCYANGLNATRHVVNTENVEVGVTIQDGQGIEVDALNYNTWVQYNYLHDNASFMMLCCYQNIYSSFNTYIRYNVSERNQSNYQNTIGYFYNGKFGFDTEVYNNTCIIDRTALNASGVLYFLYDNGGSQNYKFYNNIFYYTESTPVNVNFWADAPIDWRSNIFYNFKTAPTNDDPANPNLNNTDPKFVKAYSADNVDPMSYKLAADSPAIGKGIVLESMSDGVNSGIDFAGNKIAAAPSIGAFEYYASAPAEATDAKAADINENGATLTWTASADSSVTSYVIKNGTVTVAEVDKAVTSYTVSGLKTGTDYTYSVYACADGSMSKAADISFTTVAKGQASNDDEDGYTLGDVNGDGVINAADAVIILQAFAGIIDLEGAPAAASLPTPVAAANAAIETAASEDGLIFKETDIAVNTTDGVDFTDKEYADEVMGMDEGTFIISFIYNASTNSVSSLFSVAKSNTGDIHYHLYFTTAGIIGSEARSGSNVSWKTSAPVLNGAGEENTIAIRYNKEDNTCTVFANGEKVHTASGISRFISGIEGADLFTIGKTPRTVNSNYEFNGTIASIEAYSTLLSDEDLKAATAPKDRTPEGLTAGNVTSSSVTLNWNVAEGVTDIAGYIVKLGDVTIAELKDNECTISGFTAGTEYTVTVASKTNAGVVSDPLTVTFTTSGTPSEGDKTAPAAPTAVNASAGKGGSATISWTAPADASNVGGYVIKNGDVVLAQTGYNTTSYTIKGLEASKEYNLSVYTVSTNGVLSDAVNVSVTTTAGGGSQYAATDVNNDKAVNAADAVLVLQYFADIIDSF